MSTARPLSVATIRHVEAEPRQPHPERAGPWLVMAGLAVLVASMGMIASIAVASPAPDLPTQLATGESLAPYRLGFVFASLLAPAFVATIVLLLAARGWEAIRTVDRLGLLFLPAYAVCSTIAYTSQYLVLPALIDRDVDAAGIWYFHDERSIPFALDLTGYMLLAIALGLLSFGFLSWSGIWRWIGLAMLAVAATSAAAFVLLAVDVRSAAGTLSAVSGALTAPLVLLAIALGLRMRHRHVAGAAHAPMHDVG